MDEVLAESVSYHPSPECRRTRRDAVPLATHRAPRNLCAGPAGCANRSNARAPAGIDPNRRYLRYEVIGLVHAARLDIRFTAHRYS
jgi:hypothetical protein